MELCEVLQLIAASGRKSSQSTDIRIGTVTSESPLAIQIDGMMDDIKAELLYLTEPVIEKKIPVLTHKHWIDAPKNGMMHTHTYSGGTTGTALTGKYLTEPSAVPSGYDATVQGQDIICWENGKKLPVQDGFIILNRKLEKGDKVILLRVQNGQKYIVLSRVFEKE